MPFLKTFSVDLLDPKERILQLAQKMSKNLEDRYNLFPEVVPTCVRTVIIWNFISRRNALVFNNFSVHLIGPQEII